MIKEKKERKYIKRTHCRECKKKLSIYNNGMYCFACNAACFARDEALIDEANLLIAASANVIRFLNSPSRIASDIRKHERIIKIQKNLIKKINSYEYNYIPKEGHYETSS